MSIAELAVTVVAPTTQTDIVTEQCTCVVSSSSYLPDQTRHVHEPGLERIFVVTDVVGAGVAKLAIIVVTPAHDTATDCTDNAAVLVTDCESSHKNTASEVERTHCIGERRKRVAHRCRGTIASLADITQAPASANQYGDCNKTCTEMQRPIPRCNNAEYVVHYSLDIFVRVQAASVIVASTNIVKRRQ
jgi:hypothetical protein